MRIRCPFCLSRAVITSHPRPKDANQTEILYCSCTNGQCAARFVFQASLSHVLSPPLSTLTDSLHEQLARLDEQTRRELLQTYCAD